MTETDDTEKVWTLMEKIGFCLLSTHDGEDIRARPMAAHVDRGENAVYFLTDARHHKDDEIRANPNVGLAFGDPGKQSYVAVTGRATISGDRARIHDLWSTPAKAWWDSPDDPDIRVLKVVPKDAQYWDSPGTLASYVKMLAAAVSDTRPAMGDNAKVRM